MQTNIPRQWICILLILTPIQFPGISLWSVCPWHCRNVAILIWLPHPSIHWRPFGCPYCNLKFMNQYYFLAIIYGPVDPHTPRGRRHLTQRVHERKILCCPLPGGKGFQITKPKGKRWRKKNTESRGYHWLTSYHHRHWCYCKPYYLVEIQSCSMSLGLIN